FAVSPEGTSPLAFVALGLDGPLTDQGRVAGTADGAEALLLEAGHPDDVHGAPVVADVVVEDYAARLLGVAPAQHVIVDAAIGPVGAGHEPLDPVDVGAPVTRPGLPDLVGAGVRGAAEHLDNGLLYLLSGHGLLVVRPGEVVLSGQVPLFDVGENLQ